MLLVTLLVAFLGPVWGLTMYPDNSTTINEAQNAVIQGMFNYCPWVHNEPGATPGMFQPPYYWWEAGVAWSAMIDWQIYTGNTTYNDWIKNAIQFQSGKNWNFMTENQTSVEGNDDQGFWGITAMNAAEKNFTKPDEGYPAWLYFAQATFNTMAKRWDNSTCDGGLRWQIFPWNAGYDYKNMVANGCLFHLAARLARFTNNETYMLWAERVWQWAHGVGFLHPINPNATDPLNVNVQVFDGAHMDVNCTNITKAEWTYDQGLMISGAAYLYNYTGDSKWGDRVKQLWGRAEIMFASDGASFFANDSILYEPSCMTKDESTVTCTNDQRCFKGIMLQFLGQTLQVMPSMYDLIWDKIKTSAQAAAWSCSGGTDGVTCGLSWLKQGWDGKYGLGEQICALDAFNTLLYRNYSGPFRASDLPQIYKVTTNTSTGSSNGSTSQGGGSVYGYGGVAGMNSTDVSSQTLDLDNGDVAGASVLTAFVILFIIGGSTWLLI